MCIELHNDCLDPRTEQRRLRLCKCFHALQYVLRIDKRDVLSYLFFTPKCTSIRGRLTILQTLFQVLYEWFS